MTNPRPILEPQLDLSDLERYGKNPAPNNSTPNPTYSARLEHREQVPSPSLPPLDYGPSGWQKAGAAIGNLFKSMGQVAKEALPYLGQAASMYGQIMESTNAGSPYRPTKLNLYEDESVQVGPGFQPIQTRNLQNVQLSKLGQSALQKLNQQNTRLELQRQATQTSRFLNEVAKIQGLPSYEQFHRDNRVEFNSRANNVASMAEFMPPSRQSSGFVPEDFRQIEGNLAYGQRPLSATDQLRMAHASEIARQQVEAEHAYLYERAQSLRAQRQAANLRQWADEQKQQRKTVQKPAGKSNLQPNDPLLEKAFSDPSQSQQNIMTQSVDRLDESRMGQVELNLDRMQSRGEITPAQRTQLEMGVKALFAHNWLTHDATFNPDGTATYRGMTVEESLVSSLAYADAKQYWSKETHLSPKENWHAEMGKAASELLEGMAHGVSAGGYGKHKEGLAYAAGELLGTVAANVGLAVGTGGVGTLLALGAYWAAREANREADAGKSINPGAVVASGALGAIPGTGALKTPLNTLSQTAAKQMLSKALTRTAIGTAGGYVQDVGTQVVQQLGDTGRIDPDQLDYYPGLATITGGAVGLSSGLLGKRFTTLEQYLAHHENKVRAGQEIHIPPALLDKQKLLNAANYSPNNAESLAVRHVLSHSNREGSVFPRLTGKVDEKNQAADTLIRNILNHPQQQVTVKYRLRYGESIALKTPIGGLRYSRNYEFLGVLEP